MTYVGKMNQLVAELIKKLLVFLYTTCLSLSACTQSQNSHYLKVRGVYRSKSNPVAKTPVEFDKRKKINVALHDGSVSSM